MIEVTSQHQVEQPDIAPGRSLYLPRSMIDWLAEDAEGKTFVPQEGVHGETAIPEWCKTKAVLPVRITARLHSKGTGIISENRKRIIHEPVKMWTWFFEDRNPEEFRPWHYQDSPIKNLKNAMPVSMFARLYEVNVGTATKFRNTHGFEQMPSVDHKGAE